MFYVFKDSRSQEEARERLKESLLAAEQAELPEFRDCITAMHHWSGSILNSFRYPYTNALTEGMNNNIKLLKRIAYGYRNFDNFRRRPLLIRQADGVSELLTPSA